MISRRIYLSPPFVGAVERELLLNAFDTNWIAPIGPDLDAFEREMCVRTGVGHAAALSSGTAALHLALRLLNVGEGDDVLVATLTFVATANAVTYVAANPVFVDCDKYWVIDAELVDKALHECALRGKLPKAVITVDLYGQCADYDAILASCAKYEVPVIQDAAEALGSLHRGRPAGSQGVLAALSFNGNKIITTSGGGMLLSNDADMIEKARFLATQARDPAPHYQHSTIGHNYRLSNLLAAIGRGQLTRLDDLVAKRRSNFSYYQSKLASLPGWSFMPEAPWCVGNRWLTCAMIDPNIAKADREKVRLTLADNNIEARPIWKPLHLQPVFEGNRRFGGARSEKIFAEGICLPSGSDLSNAELDRIVDIIRSA